MKSIRATTALIRELMKVAHSIGNVRALVEQDADPGKILVETGQVYKMLIGVQQALVTRESGHCVDEVVRLTSPSSKIKRLHAYLELVSRYGR